MDLGQLKGLKEINGHKTLVFTDLEETHPEIFNEDGSTKMEDFEKVIQEYDILVEPGTKVVSFRFKEGKSEVGVTVKELLYFARLMLTGNDKALQKIDKVIRQV